MKARPTGSMLGSEQQKDEYCDSPPARFPHLHACCPDERQSVRGRDRRQANDSQTRETGRIGSGIQSPFLLVALMSLFTHHNEWLYAAVAVASGSSFQLPGRTRAVRVATVLSLPVTPYKKTTAVQCVCYSALMLCP